MTAVAGAREAGQSRDGAPRRSRLRRVAEGPEGRSPQPEPRRRARAPPRRPSAERRARAATARAPRLETRSDARRTAPATTPPSNAAHSVHAPRRSYPAIDPDRQPPASGISAGAAQRYASTEQPQHTPSSQHTPSLWPRGLNYLTRLPAPHSPAHDSHNAQGTTRTRAPAQKPHGRTAAHWPTPHALSRNATVHASPQFTPEAVPALHSSRRFRNPAHNVDSVHALYLLPQGTTAQKICKTSPRFGPRADCGLFCGSLCVRASSMRFGSRPGSLRSQYWLRPTSSRERGMWPL